MQQASLPPGGHEAVASCVCMHARGLRLFVGEKRRIVTLSAREKLSLLLLKPLRVEEMMSMMHLWRWAIACFVLVRVIR